MNPTMAEATKLRRLRLVDHLQNKPYGYVVSYGELQDVLGVDARQERGDAYWVRRQLERAAQRTLENVRNEGYRVAEPKDHERLALQQRKFASRRIRRAQNIIDATNRTVLTPEEDRRLTDLEVKMSRAQQVLDRHGQRLKAVEQSAQLSVEAQADLESRLSRIEQALQMRQPS